MTTGEAVLLWLGSVTVLSGFALLLTAIVVLKIARELVKSEAVQQAIPRRSAPALDEVEEVLKAVNVVHAEDEEKKGAVDVSPAITEILGGQVQESLEQDRDAWWREKREEGLSEKEIHEMEDRMTVPVFEEGG